MLGFHPFSTQAFSSAVPFLDVQTTTNLVSSAISGVTTVLSPQFASAGLALTVVNGGATPVTIMTPTGVALATAINGVAPFTWAAVSDTTSETWSQVNDSSSQTWTQVDDTTSQEWSDL